MNYFQGIRQKFIKDSLMSRGFISREDIIKQFRVGSATATRDITFFKNNNSGIEYNVTSKRYEKR